MNKLMDTLVNFFAVIFCKAGNWIIVVFAVINVVVYFWNKRAIKEAKGIFNPPNDKVNGVSANMQWSDDEIRKLKEIRDGLVTKYAWYANITAILFWAYSLLLFIKLLMRGFLVLWM